MITQAEQYFLAQLAAHVRPEEVVATGYFRSFIPDRPRANLLTGLKTLAEAAEAHGHFLALTHDRLLVVKTRAPAFSSPLLENKGVVSVPLSSIRNVALATDVFLIESDVETLALQLRVSNKSFPNQGRLLEEFARRFNLSASVASIRAAQARKVWLKIGLLVAAIIVAVLWAKFWRGN